MGGRAAWIMIAVGAISLAAASARAQSCMCAPTAAEPLVAVSSDSAATEQDGMQARARALTPHDVTGPEPSPLDALSTQAATVVPPLPLEGDDLPWCTTPNDRRCSKLPAGSAPSGFSFDTAPLALGVERPPLASAMSRDLEPASRSFGCARSAMRACPERPPR